MMFEREVHEQYKKAYALALRNLRDKKKMRLPLCPAAHITLPDEKMVSYRIDLGVIEIPTNLIIGVSEETEDTSLYTKGFLPISAPNSAFADLWRSLYQTLQSDHGFSEEISCCEYLGKFYVQDGLKRVSVGKFLGIPVMKARVIRIFPMHMDAQEAAVYFDFLRCYRLTKLYQLQFTQTGFFEKLQTALGRRPGDRWSDADRTRFLVHWSVIEYGKKRVSILKDNGTMMVKAKVIRILPVETDEPQIQNYYKFIKTFEKTGLYQIVFTQADMADQFLKALGYDPEHVWDESDRYSFMFHWYPFERALKLAFDDNLQITTADAMMVLLEKYSYEELRQLPSWTLAELMQESWMEMYQISNPDFKINARIA